MVFLLPISDHIYIQITLFTQFMYLDNTNSKYGKSHRIRMVLILNHSIEQLSHENERGIKSIQQFEAI